MMHKRGKKLFAGFLTISLLLSQTLTGGMALAQTAQSNRLFGSDRYKTAVEISKKGWPSGSSYAVIARGDDFADALTAGPLAKKYNAPVLLTETGSINASTLSELKRLGVKNVFITGGTGAVSQNAENTIVSSGIEVERIWGSDRYETSAKIAEKIGTSTKVALATGEDFPDALSVSVVASKLEMPVLLTQKDSLPSRVAKYITDSKVTQTYVIGGTGVISDKVKNEVPGPVRLGGADRYETNVLVMKEFASQFNFNKVYIAVGDGPSGDEFADALSGAALAARTSSPVVLAYKSVEQVTGDFLKTKVSLATVYTALGGEAVVSPSVVQAMVAFKDAIPVKARYDKAGTYGPAQGTETINGNVVISSNDVVLKNVVIEGDLLLAESIGDGDVTLNNVTVKGTTIVNGGGPNSIVMYNFNGQQVIVDVPEGSSVRLVAQGNTTVASVSMDSNGKLEESNLTGAGFTTVVIPEGAAVTLSGSFTSVDVAAGGASVNLTSGSINTLTVSEGAVNAEVNLASGTSVTTLVASAPAEVRGTGSITTAHISSNGVTIAQTPSQVTRTSDVTEGQVGSNPVTEAPVGNEPTTPPPSDGGGGSYNPAPPTIQSMENAIVNNTIKTIRLDPPYNISGASITVSRDSKVRLHYVNTNPDEFIELKIGEWSFNRGENELTLIDNVEGFDITRLMIAALDAGIDSQDVADAVNFTAILETVKNDANKDVIYDRVIPELLDVIRGEDGQEVRDIYAAVNMPGLYGVADQATQDAIEAAFQGAVQVYIDNAGDGDQYAANVFASLVSEEYSADILTVINNAEWYGDFYEAIDFTAFANAVIGSSSREAIYDEVDLTDIFQKVQQSNINKYDLYLAMANAFDGIKDLENRVAVEEEIGASVNALIGMMFEEGKQLKIKIYNDNITNPSESQMNTYTIIRNNSL